MRVYKVLIVAAVLPYLSGCLSIKDISEAVEEPIPLPGRPDSATQACVKSKSTQLSRSPAVHVTLADVDTDELAKALKTLSMTLDQADTRMAGSSFPVRAVSYLDSFLATKEVNEFRVTNAEGYAAQAVPSFRRTIRINLCVNR